MNFAFDNLLECQETSFVQWQQELKEDKKERTLISFVLIVSLQRNALSQTCDQNTCCRDYGKNTCNMWRTVNNTSYDTIITRTFDDSVILRTVE